MQIVRGFFLCGIVCLAAWPASAFFAEPQLLPLLQFASLSSIGLCFTSTKFFTARRHLSVATVTVIEVGTQCITLVVLILLSVLLRSVWALVIGNIIGVVLKSALTQFCLPGPVNRICWDRAAVQELFRFGRWIFLSTAVTFLATQGDRLLLGKFLTLELLGAYTIAASLATIPQAILSAIGQRIVFPGLARVSNDREKMQSAHQRISEPLLMMTGFIIILGLSSGQSLIHLLYDSRYLPAGWMFMPLIIAQWFFVMESLSSTVALVYGKSQWVAISTLTRVAFLYPLGLLAFSSLNSAAAICIMSATIIPQWLLSSFWAKQLGFHLIGAQLKSTLILAAICGSTQILIQYCGIDRSRSGMGILLGIAGIIIWILVHFKVVVSWTNGIQKSENGD